MKHLALKTLETLTIPEQQRQRRLTELLHPPDQASANWFMFVPTCFNAALDIQETVRVINKQETLQWTQGSKFSFSVGDIIYDTPKAYKKWAEAVKYIRYCFHVTSATDVASANGSEARRPGTVTFDLLMPNETQTALARKSTHKVSQDDFVRLLIVGASPQLTLSLSDTLF